MAKVRQHDGDLYVSGNLRVLGGIQNVKNSETVTRLATSESAITTIETTLTEAVVYVTVYKASVATPAIPSGIDHAGWDVAAPVSTGPVWVSFATYNITMDVLLAGWSDPVLFSGSMAIERRYRRFATQPDTPTEQDPIDWLLSIPASTLPCWMTQALKYESGALVNTWSVPQRTITVEDTEAIRAGDLIDGAISRVKLEAGFVTEHDTVITDLSQETVDRIAVATDLQTQVNVEKPKTVRLIDIQAQIEDLLSDTEARTIDNEYGFKRAYQEIEGDRTRLSSIEVDIDGIEAVVSEVGPTIERVSAVEIDIDGITSTVALMSPEVDKISTIEQTVDGIESTVAIMAPDVAKVSTIEQNVGSIRAAVFEDGYAGSKIAQLELDVSGLAVTVADMIGTYWTALTAFALGDRVNVLGDAYECTTAGTTAATEPTWDQANPVTDGTVVWTYQGTYVADLTQLQVNSEHIAGIVADGGYFTDDVPPVFVPTKAYTTSVQTKDRFEHFIAGTPDSGDEAAWIATQDDITSFVVGSDITAITGPLADRILGTETDIGTIVDVTVPGLVSDIGDVATGLVGTNALLDPLLVPATGTIAIIQSDITTVQQTQDSFGVRVDTLYSPDSPPSVRDRYAYLDWLDSAYDAASSQFLVSENGIRMEVQDRKELGVEMSAAIVIEADRITSEVSRASEAEGTLATQIVQTAESINLAVFGTEGSGPLPVAQAQLAIVKDSIAAQVSGGGASATLALSVTLPTQIDETTYQNMCDALVEGVAVGSTKVLAVYAPQPDLTYAIKGDATIADFLILKHDLRDAGLLGSQITLDADEILLGGKVKAINIDVVDLNASGTVVVGQSQVTDLATTLSGKEVAGAAATARDDTAVTLGYESWADMEAKAALGQTIITGGYIRTDLIKASELSVTTAQVTGTLDVARITGLGSLSTKSSVGNSDITAIDGSKITTGEIVSNNFVSGSAGWRIKKDGLAEFQNVTVKGTISAGTVLETKQVIAPGGAAIQTVGALSISPGQPYHTDYPITVLVRTDGRTAFQPGTVKCRLGSYYVTLLSVTSLNMQINALFLNPGYYLIEDAQVEVHGVFGSNTSTPLIYG